MRTDRFSTRGVSRGSQLRCALIALAAAAGLCVAPAARADFRLRVEDLGTGTGIVLTDTGGTGVISYSGSLGGSSVFTLTVTTGISKPVQVPYGSMDLNSVTVDSKGAGTLQITLEDTDFVASANPLPVGANIGGTQTNGSITYQAWADGTNAVINLGADQSPAGALGAIGSVPGTSTAAWSPAFTSSSIAFSGSSGGPNFTVGNAFSLMQQVTLTFNSAGVASFDAAVTTVPEPNSVVIAGIGVAGLLGMGWWRRRSIVAVA